MIIGGIGLINQYGGHANFLFFLYWGKIMNLKEKFHTVVEHVKACGTTEGVTGDQYKSLKIGRKTLNVYSFNNECHLNINVGDRWAATAIRRDGRVFMDFGHEDALHLIYVDVIKQPL